MASMFQACSCGVVTSTVVLFTVLLTTVDADRPAKDVAVVDIMSGHSTGAQPLAVSQSTGHRAKSTGVLAKLVRKLRREKHELRSQIQDLETQLGEKAKRLEDQQLEIEQLKKLGTAGANPLVSAEAEGL
eukprot:CAMPEP_0179327074 /NCGR_PEP_ID=MMETSP0797-20121207/61762_1 /TAXON_ID=47934 /ORGANISM="Dinophysis acuminata, Strain DAEP01" /LENGTH=129 /DNA_ID=CAMNT_0021039363 /DNA_START=40 /DNA_END=425 /DNA_ORIENTATION=+